MTIEDIKGWLHPDEGALLYEFAKKLPGNSLVVEIGSFMGKSTAYLASGLRDGHGGKVIAIDPHLGETGTKWKFSSTWKQFNKNIRNLNLETLVNPVRKTSENAHKNWDKKINLLNIDGLHDYENVKLDLKLWLPHLKNDGVLVCHDAFGPTYPGVMRAIIEEVFSSTDFGRIGVVGCSLFAVKCRPGNFIDRLNFLRSKFFIALASKIYNSPIPINFRNLIVDFVLKIFILNSISFPKMLARYYENIITFINK
ncbi:MAG: class I SAM-dependent methyltransferase [bacterium]|nr:class I SAM-dependent methyltransferase [bacterium]